MNTINMTKRFFLLMAMVMMTIIAAAQNTKKVAVWETKCSDNSITPLQATIVRGGMETAVGNTDGFDVFDRSAFDIIMKEHNFQRSGAVNDDEIKQLGKLAGVQYIIVPEAMTSGDEFYIVVKMLDVETGKFGGVYDILCSNSGSEIHKACRELGKKLFGESTNPGKKGSVNRQDVSKITINVGNVSFEMVKVEAGSFVMGCTSDQGGECRAGENPNHTVTISHDYYIGVFEVTQELYEIVMRENPSGWKEAKRPVENVRWLDALTFCDALSKRTGRKFSLPTEAEWEYAARGGRKALETKYSGSNSIDEVAYYVNNSDDQPHIVGRLKPNELGIYDMSGNVSEWCRDLYGKYNDKDEIDPKGSESGGNVVLRGGNWHSSADKCRVAYRGYAAANATSTTFGFRVVMH